MGTMRRFIGGPHDGHQRMFADPPPPVYWLAVRQAALVRACATSEVRSEPIPRAGYQLGIDGHYHFDR